MAKHLVIMAGGIGSRFWPMSTPQCPKQFSHRYNLQQLTRWESVKKRFWKSIFPKHIPNKWNQGRNIRHQPSYIRHLYVSRFFHLSTNCNSYVRSKITKNFWNTQEKKDLVFWPMKLSITRKKKTESISVENDRVNEIRKETQLDVNLELSDIPKSLVDFIKKHL